MPGTLENMVSWIKSRLGIDFDFALDLGLTDQDIMSDLEYGQDNVKTNPGAELEKERLEKERLEKERLEKERLEKERLEKERLEKERLEKERLEQERLEQERLEKERLEKERLEKERLEQERLERERLEKERLEKERLEKERLEQERLERERLEKERLEKERLEKERLEKERLEQERLEKERLAKEKLEKEKLAWTGAEASRQDIVKKLAELKQWGTAGEAELSLELKACEDRAGRDEYDGALTDFNKLKEKVDPLHQTEAKKASDKKDWETTDPERKDATQKLNELKGWKVAQEKDLRTELEGCDTKASNGDFEEATRDFKEVKKKIDPLYTTELQKAKDKTAYYKELKKQHARIKTIDQAITAKTYGDPPLTPVKEKVEAYTDAKGKVVLAQNGGDFTDAKTKLGLLVTAMKELEAARLKELETELNGANTQDKVKDIVAKLQPNEIGALPPAKQVALLKTLRTGTAVDEKTSPELYKARCKIYDNMQMQPEFVQKDKVMLANVLKAFENDTEFDNAKKDWGTMTQTKRFEFLTYAANKQCGVMGQPEPDVKVDPTLAPRKCSNYILTCKTLGCTNINKTWNYKPGDVLNCKDCNKKFGGPAQKCDTVWHNTTGKGNCTVCNAPDTGAGVTFGGCNLDMLNNKNKNKIELNGSDNVVGDFQETFDTIMHENAHNYQIYLVKRYRANKVLLFSEIPGTQEIEPQIMMWDENLNGYVPGGPTYDKQPVEIHAWKFGRKMAAKKLNPKAKAAVGDKPQGVSDLT